MPSSPDTRSDFDYLLPEELIAQRPLATRSASRMLRLDSGTAGAAPSWRDLHITDLPGELQAGDLLVFNDTRVLPARLAAQKSSGGRVEIFLERPLAGRRALVQLRASKGFHHGQLLITAGGTITIIARHEDLWEIELPEPTVEFFERHGTVPLPPYITRSADEDDRARYQSLLARVPGAVAAPTASLHFDEPLLAALRAHGINRAVVTLHVGAGTFQPIRTENIDEHRMHAEWFDVSPDAVTAIQAAKAAQRRVVAVGTTVARALESAAASGQLLPGAADTTLFIRPGYGFRVIDALLTNFHLPQSTLLMLVSALAGRERVMAAYEHAVRERYRFFSYGDCMLVSTS